ncbi:chascon isoform d-related [Anaeramoeba flamelloides]|uniref:Chascon isoform d-related n=1 Tax=Anaeramoeba flamelloides TaxID=1746091 RepID=A0AAV7ZEX0_9EUKA|nr:chascon isoform d-related [Anaeramoeba flamelloides]
MSNFQNKKHKKLFRESKKEKEEEKEKEKNKEEKKNEKENEKEKEKEKKKIKKKGRGQGQGRGKKKVKGRGRGKGSEKTIGRGRGRGRGKGKGKGKGKKKIPTPNQRPILRNFIQEKTEFQSGFRDPVNKKGELCAVCGGLAKVLCLNCNTFLCEEHQKEFHPVNSITKEFEREEKHFVVQIPKCYHCVNSSTFFCFDCDHYYCLQCEREMHALENCKRHRKCHLKQKLSHDHGKEVLCLSCDKEVGVYFCGDCNTFLCEKCNFMIHKQVFENMKQHKVINSFLDVPKVPRKPKLSKKNIAPKVQSSLCTFECPKKVTTEKGFLIKIQPRNPKGKKVNTKGVKFIAKIKGYWKPKPVVFRKNSEGLYVGKLFLKKTGLYSVEITRRSINIKGSPFKINVI